MPRDLQPARYPHFMARKGANEQNTYRSAKILGQIYDHVELVDFVPVYDTAFDKRILEAFVPEEDHLAAAAKIKSEYDEAVLRIMAQHDIRTEFEVWTTFVMHHSSEWKDFKFHEELGDASLVLKEHFRDLCEQAAGGREFEKLSPFVAAMYKVTHDEMEAALEECRQVKMVGGKEVPVRTTTIENMPLMSFPWLFHTVLGRIANHNFAPRALPAVPKYRPAHQRSSQVEFQPTMPDLISFLPELQQAVVVELEKIEPVKHDITATLNIHTGVHIPLSMVLPPLEVFSSQSLPSSPEQTSESSPDQMMATPDSFSVADSNGYEEDGKVEEDNEYEQEEEEEEEEEEETVVLDTKPSLLERLEQLNTS